MTRTVVTGDRPESAGPVARTERGRRTREGLIAAARAVFEERGFNDTRMSDIAERAGVSHGTVYVYFESKAALLTAVVTQLLDDVADYLLTAEHDDAVGRIAEANLRYLRIYGQHARLLQVVEQVATSDETFAGVLSDFRARHVARITEGIRRLQSEGRAAGDLDPEVAAAALSAMVEGFARHSPQSDGDAVAPTLTALWLRALGMSADAAADAGNPNSPPVRGARAAAGAQPRPTVRRRT